MRKAVFILVTALLWSLPARANVPNTFSVQGVLRDSTGKLQSMMVAVTINLWDSKMNGNQLGGPYQQTVMATNGLFTIAVTDPQILTKIGSSGTGQVWLEVIAGNDTFPRQLATPGMYSLQSALADTATDSRQLGGVAASSYALKTDIAALVDTTSNQTIAGNKTFTNTTHISVATPATGDALVLAGALTVGSGSNRSVTIYGNSPASGVTCASACGHDACLAAFVDVVDGSASTCADSSGNKYCLCAKYRNPPP